MEKKYLKPTCSLISVKEECYLLNTSRYGDVGNHENTNPNIGKEHYGDPTGPIEKKDGGEVACQTKCLGCRRLGIRIISC